MHLILFNLFLFNIDFCFKGHFKIDKVKNIIQTFFFLFLIFVLIGVEIREVSQEASKEINL